MRPLELVRACYGGCELIWPSGVYRALSGGSPPNGAATVLRVLGARHVVQAVLLTGADRMGAPHTMHRMFSLVDAAHCATMVALAVASPRLRRPARIDAVIAGSFAALENAGSGERLARRNGWPRHAQVNDRSNNDRPL